MTVNRSLAQMCTQFSPTDYVGTTAGLGLNEDWGRFQGFSYNPDVDSGTTPELIWPVGGVMTRPTTAGVTQLVSDSVNDTSAGTGARTVLVSGLDANYLEIGEIVTMNGTTPVTCANTYLRINLLTVQTAGSGQTNIGAITATINDGSPKTVSSIAAGYGISNVANFTIADNYQTALLQSLFINATRAGSGFCDFTLVLISSANVKYTAAQYSLDFTGNSFVPRDIIYAPLVIAPKTDVQIICTATSANNVAVNVLWNILLAKK